LSVYAIPVKLEGNLVIIISQAGIIHLPSYYMGSLGGKNSAENKEEKEKILTSKHSRF
jgi:hypothetical protein